MVQVPPPVRALRTHACYAVAGVGCRCAPQGTSPVAHEATA